MQAYRGAPAPVQSRVMQPEPSGRTNAWIRLTSHGWDVEQPSLHERESARRSRLASWIILGLFVVALVLLPLGLGDASTATAIGVFLIGLVVAAFLNRRGWVSAAGILLIVLLCGAVLGSLAGQPGGLTVDALPVYDLFVIAVVVAASILPRTATFIVAVVNSAIIVLDYTLEPRDPAQFKPLEAFYGGPTSAAIALLARPVALEIIIAVVAYLWVRGTDAAIRRADRAEEVGALEHQIAEQKRQLDIGVQQILQTHIRAANGDFSARAPLGQDNALWQISSSLNNLLARLQRAGNAEFRLQRTEEELARLASALRDAQAGRRPIWPVPSGTSVDQVIEVITGGQRRALPPEPPYGGQQPGPYTSGPLYPGGQQPGGYNSGPAGYTGPINSNPNY